MGMIPKHAVLEYKSEYVWYKMRKQSSYHNSLFKKCFEVTFALGAIFILAPVYLPICFLLKFMRGGPVFFKQKRVGKDGKVFTLIKFRTMRPGAEKELTGLKHLNEVDGPVFKIRDDPRLTKVGKFLAHTGLDELPQLINVVRGEMSLVGPRPLPVYEAEKLTRAQKIRELVKPGITSSWITSGAHNLKFGEWMELDKKYVESAKLATDLSILSQTAILILRMLFKLG